MAVFGGTSHVQRTIGINCLTKACLILARRCSTTPRRRCHYEVLDVPLDANSKQIREAYVKKTKEYHPDRNIEDPSLHELFVEVNEAYRILSHRMKRKEYDFLEQRGWSKVPGRQPTTSQDPFGTERHSSTAYKYYDESYRNFYEKHPYASNMFRDYGFANKQYAQNRKSANRIIAGLVVIFMLTGSAVIYLYIRFQRQIYNEYIEAMSKENRELYHAVKEKARLNGTKRQLEQLLIDRQLDFSSRQSSSGSSSNTGTKKQLELLVNHLDFNSGQSSSGLPDDNT